MTLTREELYELVWEKPVSRLAEEFDISDRGLAKLCARHAIPTPPRGYWARKAAGTSPKRARLPASVDTRPIQLGKRRNAETTPDQNPYDAALAELRRTKARFPVAERLRRPCESVKEARALLANAPVNDIGIVDPPKGCLDVCVSKAQLSRALRIADALLQVFAEREWPVRIHDRKTVVHVGEVPFTLSIVELMETIELLSGPADLSQPRLS